MTPILMLGVVLVTGVVTVLVSWSLPNFMDKLLALIFGATLGLLSAAAATIVVSLLAGITDPKVGDHFKQSCVLYLPALGGVVMMFFNYYSTSPIGNSDFAVYLFWAGLFSGLTLLGNALGLCLIGLWKEARSG